MGRMKELFMKIHYPDGDLEREYLFNDILAKENEYEEYLILCQDSEIRSDQTKIEINGTTRIEVNRERNKDTEEVDFFGSKL